MSGSRRGARRRRGVGVSSGERRQHRARLRRPLPPHHHTHTSQPASPLHSCWAHQGAQGGPEGAHHGDGAQEPEVSVQEGLDVEVGEVLEQQVHAEQRDCSKAGDEGRSSRGVREVRREGSSRRAQNSGGSARRQRRVKPHSTHARSRTRGGHWREQPLLEADLLALAGAQAPVRPDVDGHRGQAQEVRQIRPPALLWHQSGAARAR